VAGYGMGAVEVACAQTCILGEGPVWDHRINKLHWVDIRGMAVLTLDPETGLTTRVPTREEVGFVALTADVDSVVAGLKSGLYRLDLKTGKQTQLVEVEADKPANRINDGTVAPDGAILFGTLDTDHTGPSGTFWRYHKGQLSHLGGAMIVTNGPGLSGDGNVALTVDSIERKVFRNTYANGILSDQSPFAEFPAGHGIPDGMTFDSEGFVWGAHYGGSRLTRFRPDGSIDQVVTLPALQVTKAAFGGPDLKTLYITTAAYRRPLADEPLAGCLFKIPVDTAGLRACIADV
jgi:sugar lactone lactonase YvrE